jgi:hypothetical protein
LLGRWPRPRHSSDRVVIGNALRCCLRISNASCGLAPCDCADRAVLSSSSRWRRSPRTCAGWLSSSPGRHRWPVRCGVSAGRVGVEASAPTLQSHRFNGANGNSVPRRNLPLPSPTSATKSVKTGKPQTEQMLSALPRIATEERTFRIGSLVPMCGRLRVGKGFLHVCSIGRCSHVFGLFARFT